jgi:hypothetical protein
LRGDAAASEEIRDALSTLPGAMANRNARMYLSADSDDDRRRVLNSSAATVGEPEPDKAFPRIARQASSR